jgi:hypothetical protein
MLLSYIGKLKLRVPWTRLGEDSAEFLLEDMAVVLELDESSIVDETMPAETKYRLLFQMVEDALDAELQRDRDPQSKEKKDFRGQAILTKILNNLKGQVRRVHFRLESKHEPKPYSFGFFLPELSFHTVN